MTTLPKEIEEEFEGQLYDFFDDNQLLEAVYEKPKMETIKAFLLKVYQSARRQALTEGIASLPPKEDKNCPENCMGDYEHGNALGANAYRAKAIAKLTQLRDV